MDDETDKKETGVEPRQFPVSVDKKPKPKTPGKKSGRQKLRESEERNKAAIMYIEVLEGVCKRNLVYAAECHEKLEIIVVPGMEYALKALEQICINTAPVCQDVEDIKLPDFAIAELMKQGGGIVQQPEEKTDD